MLTFGVAHYTIAPHFYKLNHNKMPTEFLPVISIVSGLLGLIWGADRFVTGSAGAARSLGIAPLIIGLTIVSIGTSAPEIIVAINASLKEAGGLAIGNAIGSNLANIGLVLGITALVAPLPTQKHLLLQESPILLVVTVIAGITLFDGFLSRTEGLLLLGLLVPVLGFTIFLKLRHLEPEEIKEEGEIVPDLPLKIACLWFVVGLAALLIGSEILVWGAKQVATQFGVSDLIIGLTIIAIGTSLPELAASVMSAMRGHHDIALGNIFGSNLFNIMAVMAMPGLIDQPKLGSEIFFRDYLAMLLITLLLISFIAWVLFHSRQTARQPRVSRLGGIILLAFYCAYCLYLIP